MSGSISLLPHKHNSPLLKLCLCWCCSLAWRSSTFPNPSHHDTSGPISSAKPHPSTCFFSSNCLYNLQPALPTGLLGLCVILASLLLWVVWRLLSCLYLLHILCPWESPSTVGSSVHSLRLFLSFDGTIPLEIVISAGEISVDRFSVTISFLLSPPP